MSWIDDDVSTEGMDPESMNRGTVSKPGKFHVELLDVRPDQNRRNGADELRFDFQVLAGTVGSEAGNLFYHREGAPHGDDNRRYFMTRLALQMGLVTKEDVGSASFKPSVFMNAKGRQYVLSVVETPNKEGTRTFLNLGRVWDVNDDAVSDVPKDIEALESAGVNSRQPVAEAATATEEFDDI